MYRLAAHTANTSAVYFFGTRAAAKAWAWHLAVTFGAACIIAAE